MLQVLGDEVLLRKYDEVARVEETSARRADNAEAAARRRVAKEKDRSAAYRDHIRLQDRFISGLLMDNAFRRVTDPNIEVCSFCCHDTPDGAGGHCPCREVFYCSRECQTLDWKRHHRQVCPRRQAERRAREARRAQGIALYRNILLIQDEFASMVVRHFYEDMVENAASSDVMAPIEQVD